MYFHRGFNIQTHKLISWQQARSHHRNGLASLRLEVGGGVQDFLGLLLPVDLHPEGVETEGPVEIEGQEEPVDEDGETADSSLQNPDC